MELMILSQPWSQSVGVNNNGPPILGSLNFLSIGGGDSFGSVLPDTGLQLTLWSRL